MEVNPAGSQQLSQQLGAGTSAMGHDEFLQLLVAQLSNQDPLSPMDNTEFVAQLAHFSSLEQMTLVNTNLETQQQLIQGNTNSLATTFIGKEIVAFGSGIDHQETTDSHELAFELALDADATLTIMDSSGATVRTLHETDLAAGRQSLEWDGRNDQGALLAPGAYTFRASAADDQGQPVQVQTYISGTVNGVRYGGGGAMLLVGDQLVLLSDVLEINSTQTGQADSSFGEAGLDEEA